MRIPQRLPLPIDIQRCGWPRGAKVGKPGKQHVRKERHHYRRIWLDGSTEKTLVPRRAAALKKFVAGCV
jgi:hypothetical protein